MLKRIYSDNILANVQNCHTILKLNGIESAVINQDQKENAGGAGRCPELWISEYDFERAIQVIENYDVGQTEYKGPWSCSHSKGEVDGECSECWSCGNPGS